MPTLCCWWKNSGVKDYPLNVFCRAFNNIPRTIQLKRENENTSYYFIVSATTKYKTIFSSCKNSSNCTSVKETIFTSSTVCMYTLSGWHSDSPLSAQKYRISRFQKQANKCYRVRRTFTRQVGN